MASYTKLTLGSRGDEVRRLQTRLNAHGANLAVDGVFGNLTLDAVKKYQRSRGLAADGVVGDLTWGRLLEGTAAAQTAAAQTAVTSGGYYRSGVSGATAEALTEYGKGYTPGQSVIDAEKALSELAGQRPGDYESPYGAELEALLGRIRERKPFSYDLNADSLYRQYRDQYMEQGRRAMADAMGQTAALTGGYGSTYGQSVGQQTYDNYLQQLNSKVPELYALALERYTAEGDKLADEYGLLSSREQDAYDRWRDAVSDWEDRLAAARKGYEDERDFDYGAWRDMLKYWQDRSDDEYAAWWKANSRAAGGSGSVTAAAPESTAPAASASREVLVHIPGYGEVTLSDARDMVAGGMLEWVRGGSGPLTDENGYYVARMRRPPVSGPFRMVK